MKTAYKIVMPILCVAVFPVLFFLPLLHLNITSSLAGSLSGNLGIREYSSLFQLVQMGKGMNETQTALWKNIGKALFDKEGTLGSVFTNTGWLYAVAVFAGLMLLLTLLTAVLAIVTKRYVLVSCFAGGALVSAFAMNKCFDAFAHPLLTGEIGITSLLSGAGSGAGSSGVLSNLLGSLAKMEALELASAYDMAFFLLLCALVFSVVTAIVKHYNKKAFR